MGIERTNFQLYFQLYFRIDDQCSVIRDGFGCVLFEATYREVEDRLDQYDNGRQSIVESLREDELTFLRSLEPLCPIHRKRNES